MLPTEDTALIPLSWSQPQHFEHLMPRSQQAKQRVTVLKGVIDLDHQGEINSFSKIEERNKIFTIQYIP
jgi:dUTPase